MMPSRISCGIAATISVSMNPGATQLTVMPLRAVSSARLWVRPSSAAIDAATAAALEHVIEHGFDHEERARDVDAQHRLPVLDAHLAHRLVDRDAGVVHEEVDATVSL